MNDELEQMMKDLSQGLCECRSWTYNRFTYSYEEEGRLSVLDRHQSVAACNLYQSWSPEQRDAWETNRLKKRRGW